MGNITIGIPTLPPSWFLPNFIGLSNLVSIPTANVVIQQPFPGGSYIFSTHVSISTPLPFNTYTFFTANNWAASNPPAPFLNGDTMFITFTASWTLV
jgi:hypothetical protein